MPQVQWEQHHPVKSSPSIQIKRLSMNTPFACLCLQLSSELDWFSINRRARIPLSRRVFSTDSPARQVTKGLRPKGQRPEDAERVGG